MAVAIELVPSLAEEIAGQNTPQNREGILISFPPTQDQIYTDGKTSVAYSGPFKPDQNWQRYQLDHTGNELLYGNQKLAAEKDISPFSKPLAAEQLKMMLKKAKNCPITIFGSESLLGEAQLK